MTTRRAFVQGTAIGLGALAAGGRHLFAMPARREKLGRIGVQLYTVRAEMQKDVAATVARIAQIGYKEVEFAGYYQLPPRARAGPAGSAWACFAVGARRHRSTRT